MQTGNISTGNKKKASVRGKMMRWLFSITATDYAGNIAVAETTVTVPHDSRKKADNKRAG